MKRIIILVTALLTTVIGMSQGLQEEKVKFKSERLPLKPLDSELEGYSFTVETPYSANNNELIENAKTKHQNDLDNYPQTILNAEKKHQEDLEQYDKDVITAQENFKLESEEYDKMTAVEKIALQEKKPVIKLPRKPVYREPAEPVYREPATGNIITFDPNVLAGSYLKLSGYKKATEGKILTGMVVLNDFQSESPERKFTEKNVYNSTTKKTEVKKTYYYTTSYSRAVYVKLQYKGEVLFEGILESSTEPSSFRSTKSPNLKNLEKQSVKESMLLANEFINSNYGYSQVNRELAVRWIKNKKGDYDDLESAKDKAINAYNDFNGGKNSAELMEAITIWKAAIDESDVENKKARINKKVTISVLLNLIEASLIIQNPSDAEAYMKTLKGLKVPYITTVLIKKLEIEIKDVKKRVAAKI